MEDIGAVATNEDEFSIPEVGPCRVYCPHFGLCKYFTDQGSGLNELRSNYLKLKQSVGILKKLYCWCGCAVGFGAGLLISVLVRAILK